MGWFDELDGMWYDSVRRRYCISEPVTPTKQQYIQDNCETGEAYLVWDNDRTAPIQELIVDNAIGITPYDNAGFDLDNQIDSDNYENEYTDFVAGGDNTDNKSKSWEKKDYLYLLGGLFTLYTFRKKIPIIKSLF